MKLSNSAAQVSTRLKTDAEFFALLAHGLLVAVERSRDPFVGEAVALGLFELLFGNRVEVLLLKVRLEVYQRLDLVQEPRVDARHLSDLFDRVPLGEREANVVEAVGRGCDQLLRDQLGVELFRLVLLAGLEAADGFRERVLERAADRHHFADAFHLHAQQRLGAREFLELPFRHFHDNVVDRGLEAGRRLARNVVGDFVEPQAHRQLGGDLGDRKPGGFRR